MSRLVLSVLVVRSGQGPFKLLDASAQLRVVVQQVVVLLSRGCGAARQLLAPLSQRHEHPLAVRLRQFQVVHLVLCAVEDDPCQLLVREHAGQLS